MQDQKISEHFMLSEFTYSATAIQKGIDNTPDDINKKCIIHTALYLLEPLRRLLNKKYKTYNNKPVKEVSIKITSGFRSSKLNSALKGSSKTSEHVKGCATDIEATIHLESGAKVVLSYITLYNDIKGWVKTGELSVNQCIQEENKEGAKWVHVSHHPSGRTCDKREFLIYKNGRYYKDKV